jgi:hypothetical protein
VVCKKSALIAREENKLKYLDEALARLDAGKYGICLGCSEPIPLERLMVLPFASYWVDCQEKRNRARRDWGEGTLRRVLKAYAAYYNEVRTHLSLDKDAPDFRRAQPVGSIAALSILGGLHHQYVRV